MAGTWQKIGTSAAIDGKWNKIVQVQVAGVCSLAGGGHGQALRSDGLVYACGNGTSGQLGDNTVASLNNSYAQTIQSL
jgi:alpha-tubulin suppressor-like RCC1 family protein